MSQLQVRRATSGDLPEVLGILNMAAAELHRRGLTQWWYGFGPDRIGPIIEAGGTFLAEPAGGGLAVATGTVSPIANLTWWTETEAAQPSWYVEKLAVAPWQSGHNYGALLLRWIADLAWQNGVPLLRLDMWRDEDATGLRRWYQDQGWRQVRVMAVPGRYSGALFDKETGPDPEVRELLPAAPAWLARRTRPALAVQTQVEVDGEPRPGHILEVLEADGGYGENGGGDDFVSLVRTYRILMPDERVITRTDLDVAPVAAT